MNNAQAPPPSYAYLHKIQSIKKQLQIFDILQALHPTHAERLWLVGFLKYTGHSYNEVIGIIDQHGEWDDYNAKVTAYQVATIFKQPHRKTNGDSKRRARKWDLTPLEEYKIKYARSMEAHRINEEWMREHNIHIYDAAPELPFDASKMELEK